MGKKINPDVGDSLPPPYQEVVPEFNPGPSRPIYPAMQVNQQPPVQMNYNQYLPPPNPPPGQFQPQFNQPNQYRPQYPLNNQVYVYQNQQYPNQFVSQQPMPINQPSVIYVQPGENLHRTLFFVGFCCPLAWCVGTNPTKLHCLQASRIVADEITVRLARRCKEIDDIPQIRDLEFTRQIKALYTKTCQELFEFTDEIELMRRGQATNSWPEQPSKSWPFSLFKSEKPIVLPENIAPPEEDLDKIVFGTECHDPILASKAEHLTDKLFHVLERAVARHKPIMLLAAQEENRALLDKLMTKDELQTFLTKFHMQRIAVRLLIGHCVALSKPLPLDNMIGIFCTKTPIEDIVTESVQLAEDLCMITYGCVPPIELSCTPESKNFDLLYIPSHLQHILFELLKNAMRAVIERELLKVGEYGVVKTSQLPPIIVHWHTTAEHCIFEVRDQGIGINPEILEKVFLFHYTTAARPIKPGAAVMAGYGYGLPLSRLYARFLKGDIWIESELGNHH
ncbi:hypothetical protein HDV04_005519 [Boothiomyces sp. JEL0838]|nr:hypothetical protein HDV04_005519 [Boothiomyces sp. JEL0838]